MATAAQRVLLMVLLGIVLGFASNAIVPKSIPLKTPPKKAPKAEEFIPLEKAHQLWNEGATYFIDARQPADYEAGHIANALNLPVEQFGEYFPKLAPMLSPDSSLIVYCDGTECELSHHLMEQLRQQGYTNIQILFNGWTAWKTAGFPILSGPAQ